MVHWQNIGTREPTAQSAMVSVPAMQTGGRLVNRCGLANTRKAGVTVVLYRAEQGLIWVMEERETFLQNEGLSECFSQNNTELQFEMPTKAPIGIIEHQSL
jgi:hypothetical protein